MIYEPGHLQIVGGHAFILLEEPDADGWFRVLFTNGDVVRILVWRHLNIMTIP